MGHGWKTLHLSTFLTVFPRVWHEICYIRIKGHGRVVYEKVGSRAPPQVYSLLAGAEAQEASLLIFPVPTWRHSCYKIVGFGHTILKAPDLSVLLLRTACSSTVIFFFKVSLKKSNTRIS